MKKLISTATSVCMAATCLCAAFPAAVSAADATKTLSISTYAQSGSEYASQGANVTISKEAIAAGDVTVPCAVYLTEATADLATLAIPITINSTNSDVKNVKFDLIDPAKPYFDTAQTITSAKGETITTKNAVVFAAGLDDMGDYAPTGMFNLSVDTQQTAAGADNYYIGFGQTFPRGYSWTGSKSDDYPVFVFDVTFPKGTSAGDYKIQYCNYIKDDKGNPALLLETEDGRYANIGDYSNLTLNEMTIKVEGDGSSSTDDGKIVVDFGEYEAKPGDKVTVNAVLKSGADKAVGSYDVKFKLDSPLSIVGYGSSSAAYGGAGIETNKETMQASFICLDQNSDPVCGEEGAAIFKFNVQIPETCADGTYNVGFDYAEIYKGGANSAMWDYETTGGTIKVTGGGSQTTEGDIVLDFGNYEAKPGDKVTVNAVLKKGADKAVGSYDVKFKLDSPLSIVGYGSSSAAYGGAGIETNKDTMQASFICLDQNSDPVYGEEGAIVFKFNVQIPETCADGTYNVGFDYAEIYKGGADSDMWTYSVENGTITVSGGGTPSYSGIGDLDKNGKVTAVDASLLLAFYADINAGTVTATDEDMYICDVNRDGKINAADASIILRYYADLAADFNGSFVEYLVQVIKVDASLLD